jgi:vitamin B12 transporter
MRKPALLLILLPITAHTQTVSDTEQVLVTATRTPTPVTDVSAGVTIIDRATIEARGYTDLVQALSAVPGLRVAQSGGPGSVASVFIRGTNSNQVLVLRDGVPINDPGDPGAQFNFGVDSLNDIERIEIVRGPMSSLYGSGAIGGVINLITRRTPGALHGEVTLAGGTNTTGLARASVGGSTGIWDFAASAEGFSTRGFDQTPPRESIYTGETDGDREKLGTIEIGLTPIAGTRISLDLRGRDSTYGYDDMGEITTYDGGNATGYDATLSGRLGVVSHLLENAWTTSLSLSQLADDRHYTVTYDPRDPNDDTENDRYHGRSTDAQWNNTLALPDFSAADRTTLTAGYDYTYNTADTHIDSVSFASPYLSATRANENTNAGYAGVQTRLWQALTLNGQVREDATSDAGNAFTWRTGGVLDIATISSRLKASYGTGFLAPSLFDRYGTDNFGYVGNPNLRPERSQGWEAGFETDLALHALGTATVSLAYFNNRLRDLIELAYAPVYTSVNIASARTVGLEAGLTWQLGPWLQTVLAYTYTDARDLSTGTRLLRRPLNQGSAELRITPIPTVTIAPELLYTGSFEDYLVNDSGADLGNTGLSPSGLIFNLNASWQLTKRLKLFAWGKNLGNSHFEPVSGYITPGPSGLFGVEVNF